MNRQVWHNFTGKRVLLLQGPVGGFFARVSMALQAHGAAEVRKINFNGGDWLFFRGGDNYLGSLDDWPEFLADYVERHCIEAIVLFGDCRPIHRVAVKLSEQQGLSCWVFEEGYVRPNYVTFEKHGVNGYSPLALTDADVLAQAPTFRLPEREVGATFSAAARSAMLYYLASTLARPWFAHHLHHRPLSVLEGLVWIRSYWRKRIYRIRDRHVQDRLAGAQSGRYFLVALQVAGDSQVHTHSGFDSVNQFLEVVVRSFAACAPHDTLLVVKHHPMDRGYHDYTDDLRRLAAESGITDRLLYVHDLHLPTLLEHARGTVVINSTVGLSALHHGTPVVTLGTALYDRPGLTYQGSLEDFWLDAQDARPDTALYHAFRNYLVAHTQINGSFYKPLLGDDPSGLSAHLPAQKPSPSGSARHSAWLGL